MARADRIEGSVPVGGAGNSGRGGIESFSYRGSELSKARRAEITAQNAAAKSNVSKNLDRVESGKKAAQSRRYNQEAKEEYAYSKGKQSGLKKGVAAGVAAGAAAEYVVSKGTQKDHAVTKVDRKTGKSK